MEIRQQMYLAESSDTAAQLGPATGYPATRNSLGVTRVELTALGGGAANWGPIASAGACTLFEVIVRRVS